MVTYFVVQPFVLGKKGMIVADLPKQANDLRHCQSLAERYSRTHHGVIAFSRSGNPEFGDWEEAVLIAQYGTVPEDILENAA